jgi:3-hydroxyisobutyrate dehydrogenase
MELTKEQAIVGLIGTGVMGKSMAMNLLCAGYTVHVYSRTKSKAEELLTKGAHWQETPSSLAKVCNVIITMVGFPQDVEAVYFGADGIIANAQPDSYLLDMTTSSPSLAARIYEMALARGLFSFDAPVSGGDVGAKEARLSIMVGGDRSKLDNVMPILQKMGTNIVYQGAAGAGQHTKMCNQIAIAGNMMGVCEALIYAEKAGLDPTTVLQSIEAGAAGSWSLSNLGPRIIQGNFAPGFYVKHFIKDMGIALDSAAELKLETPSLALAKSLYVRLAEMGEENSGTQALYKVFNHKY